VAEALDWLPARRASCQFGLLGTAQASDQAPVDAVWRRRTGPATRWSPVHGAHQRRCARPEQDL